jgi:hypothetical protein
MGARDRNVAPARTRETGATPARKLDPMDPRLELRGKYPVGRDPREMTPEELKGAGHKPISPLQALQARCLDCCAGQTNEVAACTVVECPAWPFRMGTNPWRRSASEGRREAARRSMERINARRRKQAGNESSASPPDNGTAPSSAEGAEASTTRITARFDRVPKSELHRGTSEGGEERNNAPGAGVPAAGVAK